MNKEEKSVKTALVTKENEVLKKELDERNREIAYLKEVNALLKASLPENR